MGLQNKITFNYLKHTIGCEKIFKHYFGNFTLHNDYCNPLRVDNKEGSRFFINEEGTLLFNDFSRSKIYNSVQFVSSKLQLPYKDALTHIANTFKIENTTGVDYNTLPKYNIKHHKKKAKSLFSVTSRQFTKQDLDWWKQFGITKQELQDNNVYSVASFSINNYTIYTKKDELRFAYLLKEDGDNTKGYFKIYTPLDKERKWVFNGRLDLVYGLESINNGFLPQPSTLIITKSLKDFLVLKKFFTEVIYVQNESKSSLNAKTIKALQTIYSNIYVWFDTDRPGLSAMWWYRKHHGFKPLYFRSKGLSIWQNLTKWKSVSDPADFVKTYGLDAFKKWLKYNNLL